MKKRKPTYQTEQITFLKPIIDLDKNDEPVTKWEDGDMLWARIFPLKMTEVLHYYVFFEGRTVEWVTPFKAIRWNNKILDIISCMSWNARNGTWIDLLTRERNG